MVEALPSWSTICVSRYKLWNKASMPISLSIVTIVMELIANVIANCAHKNTLVSSPSWLLCNAAVLSFPGTPLCNLMRNAWPSTVTHISLLLIAWMWHVFFEQSLMRILTRSTWFWLLVKNFFNSFMHNVVKWPNIT